jgi:hypothetical protein
MKFNLLNSILSRFKGANNRYNFGYEVLNTSTDFNKYKQERDKLNAVLSNPALLKVFSLQCDLFSMGAVSVWKDETEIPEDPFLKLLHRPNPYQTQSQFLWDFMFWNMLGTSYTYVDSKAVDKIGGNKMYFLDPSKMEWPHEIEKNKDKMVFSREADEFKKRLTIKYTYNDSSSQPISLDRVIINTDLTNGIGNFYKGASRIEALYKVLSNSEFALDAKNINIRYSGKFLVGAVNDISKIGLGQEEKEDLENKIDTNDKKVWAYKVPVQIRRFVDDMAALQLDQAYLADYFLIGNMYGIPRDVLEAYQSSTYENQEKARAAHINYCLEPKGNQFMDSFERFFGYEEQGKNIYISWDHLPFMQIFEKEKVEVNQAKINAFKSMIDMGIDAESANEFLDTDFKITKNETANTATGQGDQSGQGQDQGQDNP